MIFGNAENAESSESLKKRRFLVAKSGKSLAFRGDLMDVTDMKCLVDMIDEETEIDAIDFSNCTWLGINNLMNALIAYNRQIIIHNVQFNVYQYLRFHHHFNTIFRLESVFLPFVGSDFDSISFQLVKSSEWETWPLDRDYFSEPKENRYLIVPCAFALPSRFYQKSQLLFGLPQTFEQFGLELSFIVKSIHLYDISFGLTIQTIIGIKDQIESIVENIRIQVQNISSGIAVLKPDYATQELNLISAIFAFIRDKSIDLIKRIEEIKANCLKLYLTILKKILAFTAGDEKELRDIYLVYVKQLNQVAEVGIEIEDFGFNLSQQIYALDCTKNLRTEVLSVEDVNSDELSAIRENMMIMDIISEDSWSDTREIILTEIDEITKKIEQSGVTLQALDLARQVLEHRVRESQHIQNEYQKQPWEEVKSRYLDLVVEKLVTDQEKFAFEFFINERNSKIGEPVGKKEQDTQPGDVLFF